MWAAKVQASLHIRAVSPEPPLLAHTSSESSGTFRQKARSLAPLNGKACAVKIVMTECSKTQNRLTRPILFSVLLYEFPAELLEFVTNISTKSLKVKKGFFSPFQLYSLWSQNRQTVFTYCLFSALTLTRSLFCISLSSSTPSTGTSNFTACH